MKNKAMEFEEFDDSEDFRLLQEAEAGDAEAQFVLGWCYYNAIGTYYDCAAAVKWWTKAAEQGNIFAREALEKLQNKN